MKSTIDEIPWGTIFTVKGSSPGSWSSFLSDMKEGRLKMGLDPMTLEEVVVIGIRPVSCGSWLICDLVGPDTAGVVHDMIVGGEDEEEYEVRFGKATPEWVSNLPELHGW